MPLLNYTTFLTREEAEAALRRKEIIRMNVMLDSGQSIDDTKCEVEIADE